MRTANHITNAHVDVLIVGAGPAACAAGLIVQNAGHTVKIIDRATAQNRPQFGECLPASGLPALRALGLEQRFHSQKHLSMQAYRVQWGNDKPYEKNLLTNAAGTGWLLDREKFDQIFIDALEEKNVHIDWQTSLSDIVYDNHADYPWKVFAANTSSTAKEKISQTIHAKALVDASGRARAVARRVGANVRKLDSLITFACRVKHANNTTPPQDVIIASDKNGWWYSAPYTKGFSSLNYFTDGDLPLPENSAALLAHAQTLEPFATTLEHTTVAPSKQRNTTAAYSSTLDHCAGPGWIAVGDAACSYDPLSSYGISSAIGSGIYGANALIASMNGKHDALFEYQDLLRTTFLNYIDGYHTEYRRVNEASSIFWKRRT